MNNYWIADFDIVWQTSSCKNGHNAIVVSETESYNWITQNFPFPINLFHRGILFFVFLYFFLMSTLNANAQIVTTIAGNGIAGSSGDGGPATAASITSGNWIASDKFGNVYFTNLYTVRKIDTSGIITTIAGNGIAGYSGDGGPATAAMLNGLQSVAVSNAGNLYIVDYVNNRIRMVNTAGIITTVAGTGVGGFCTGTGPATSTAIFPYFLTTDSAGNLFFTNNYSICKINTLGIVSIIAGNPLVSGFSGDGGAATACLTLGATAFATDKFGNLYFTDGFGAGDRIRKISPAGIITTVAGNGTSGYSGDGGQATNAQLYDALGLTVDSVGKLYIADANNRRVRVVNTAGVITTIAGTGIAGYSGDGGPATAAKFTYPGGVAVGKAGDIYIPDYYRIRKVSYQNRPPRYSGGHSQSLAVCANSLYDSIGTQLSVVDSDYGQAETWSTVAGPVHGTLVSAATGYSNGGLLHPAGLYYMPAAGYTGNDSFRVRVSDGIAADSTTIHITVSPGPAAITGAGSVCVGATTTLADTTTGGYWSSAAPLVATVGTSGVVSGVLPGTVAILYHSGSCSSQKVVTVNAIPAGFPVTGGGAYCAGGTGLHVGLGGSGSGVSYQLWRGVTGLGTLTGTGPALDFGAQIIAGVYTVVGTATSSACSHNMAGSATITVNPLPAVITGPTALCTGTTITEHDTTAGGVWSSAGGSASVGSGSGIVTGIALGTAVITYTLPTTCMTTTTVTVSAGPGVIGGAGTVCAGATTTLTNSASGGVWTSSLPANAIIGSLSGLVTGGIPGTTTISYSLGAGCTVTKTITINASPAAITGAGSVCAGSVITLTDATGGGVWSAGSGTSVTGSGTTATVTGVSAGASAIDYTVAGCAASKTVTVYATPAAISGPTAVCTAATITAADATTGGTWSTGTAGLTIGSGSGVVTGITAGTGSITYALGACAATRTITVNATPAIAGPTGICNGATATLTASVPGGTWGSSASIIATIGSTGPATAVVTGIANGTAVISYTLPTGCTASLSVTVNSAPSAISGSLHVCTGATTILSDTAGGGVWSAGSGVSVGTTGIATSSLITGVAAGIATITYSLGGGCTVTAIVTVTASPAAITGPGSVCAGAAIIVTDLTAGGVWSAGSGEVSVAGSGGTATVAGLSVGTVTVAYTAAGCAATRLITVNLTPAAIAGVSYLCAGLTSMLSETTAGGTWSSSLPAIATVTTTGSPLITTLEGVADGVAIISYSLPDGCAATRPITINAAAAPITGSLFVCIGSSAAQADITPGGSWSSSLPAIGSVSASGIITGIGVGVTILSYTAGGCQSTKAISVNALPGAIGGVGPVCVGVAMPLSNATTGGIWSSSNAVIGAVGSGSGVVTGVSAGSATISYSLGVGCTVTTPVTVSALPAGITGPAGVCAGGTATMSDPVAGGVWSSSDMAVGTITATGVVTGLAAGVTTISYYVGAIGCAATRNISTITVPAITGIHDMCAWGDTMSINNTISTGIYTSSLATVTNLGGGNGRVTGNAPGTATVMYLLPSGCTTSATFTVNALPAAISGAAGICIGGTETLSDVTPGGAWSTGSSAASVGSATGVVTGLAAGSATIVYTAAITGCKADTVITVTGTPVAGVLTGVGSMCAGSSVTLTDSATGGLWSNIGGATTITSTGATWAVISGSVVGVDTIVYSVSNMCGTATARMAVTVEPVPLAGVITGVDSLCMGGYVVLAASVSGGVWSVSNTSAGVDTAGKVTGLAAGIDTVIYSVSNAWCGAQTTYPVKVIAVGLCPSLGVVGVGIAKFKVWPNPADGNITVSCGQGGVLKVIDAVGRSVGEYKMRQGNNNITLAAGVNDGIFLVVFNGDNGMRETVRLVVE
jgi:hypothetical protein